MQTNKETLPELILTMILGAFNILLKLFMLTKYWIWFIVPIMMSPSTISMPIAFGIMSMFSLMLINTNKIQQAFLVEAKYLKKSHKEYTNLALQIFICFALLATFGITYFVSTYV